MEINQALKLCFDNKIKVYPIIKDKKFIVEVEHKGKKTQGKIKHTQKTINKAIEKTYIYYAENILKTS